MSGAGSSRLRTFFSKFISTVPFWTIFTFQCSANRWALVGRLMIPRAYHYKKEVPIRELFEEDRKALLVLPPKRFNVCRYECMNADGYGKICMDGKHLYSTAPENA